MPAFTILGSLTTKPLAGDDFQIVCIILMLYRVIQSICLVPIMIVSMIQLYSGADLIIEVDGERYGSWCPQYAEYTDSSNNFILLTAGELYDDYSLVRNRFRRAYVVMAGVFMAIDIAWILLVWNAALLGTPTQPEGRTTRLRRLIFLRLSVINFFPIILLVFGCLKVAITRMDNYGCGEDEELVSSPPDSGVLYGLFSVLLVTYALELFIYPSIVAKKVVQWFRMNKVSELDRVMCNKNNKSPSSLRLSHE